MLVEAMHCLGSGEGQHSSALLASAATAGARREANAGVWPSRAWAKGLVAQMPRWRILFLFKCMAVVVKTNGLPFWLVGAPI